jgi:hypothetical protein
MNAKIICILVMTLLISAAIPIISANENDYDYKIGISNNVKPLDVPDKWLKGADQYQTDRCKHGMVLSPKYHNAQEFKPTKEDLTAVLLHFFNIDAPSNVDITVGIRESLDGQDLITMTINADNKKIKPSGTWVMFDFDDIVIVPEEIYYIVCYASDGVIDNCYCWYFNINSEYDRGESWGSVDGGNTWINLTEPPEWPEVDLTFITYYQEPPDKSRNILRSNNIIMRLLERFTNLFPLLQKLIQQFGL